MVMQPVDINSILKGLKKPTWTVPMIVKDREIVKQRKKKKK